VGLTGAGAEGSRQKAVSRKQKKFKVKILSTPIKDQRPKTKNRSDFRFKIPNSRFQIPDSKFHSTFHIPK
jgi:hypothetical protein